MSDYGFNNSVKNLYYNSGTLYTTGTFTQTNLGFLSCSLIASLNTTTYSISAIENTSPPLTFQNGFQLTTFGTDAGNAILYLSPNTYFGGYFDESAPTTAYSFSRTSYLVPYIAPVPDQVIINTVGCSFINSATGAVTTSYTLNNQYEDVHLIFDTAANAWLIVYGSNFIGPTGSTGPTGAASSVTGPTGAASSVTGPTGPNYWSPTGPTGIYYNNPILSYDANSSITITPTRTTFIKSGIQEAVGYQSGSFASPFTYTLWSDYYYNYIYITSLSSTAGIIGIITLPAITSADDGRYVQFRRTGGTTITSQAQAALQIVTVNSPSVNIVGVDNTIFNTAVNTINLTGTQLMRKFQIATISGISYWFVSNDA